MTGPGPIEVDAVVRSVLADLFRGRGGDRGGHVYSGRLFGVRQVEALGPDEREVRVVAGTVVTPSANEMMKRRGIRLRTASGDESRGASSRGAGEWAFAIEGRGTGATEAIRRSLLHAWSELPSAEAPRWIVSARGRGAMLLTPEASVAAWRANRVEGLRAASASDTDAVSRAVRHLGVNLLVVEPAGLSIPTVRALAEAFRRGGAPGEPEGLR